MRGMVRIAGGIACSALAAAALVFAAACGGGDDGDGGGDGNGAQATATKPAAEPTAKATDAPATPAATGAPAVTLDVCSLVAKADIEAAIGAPVLDGKPEQAANLFTCSYAEPEFSNFSAAGVAVLVADNASDAKEAYDLAKSNAAEVQEVDGLGEAAYWDSILNTMQILEGRYELSVDVSSEEGRDQLAAARAIATKALAALP